MKKAAVIIPVYKEFFSEDEKISLLQCREYLSDYDIIFLIPNNIDLNIDHTEIIICTNPKNLSSRRAYSDYVLSMDFYNLFVDYEYILIYQLDAFVFRNELNRFIELDYDYIGAKWPFGMECHTDDNMLWYYGNGGLSLRKISSFLEWTKKDKERIDSVKEYLNEDLIISIYGRDYLKIAEDPIATNFSFDVNPLYCYEKNNNKLPFGCHAWNKFNRLFWKDVFSTYGREISSIEIDEVASDFWDRSEARKTLLYKYFNDEIILNSLKELIIYSNSNIYIFGAGQYGFSFLTIAKRIGINVIAVIDNDKYKRNKFICEKKIISLDEAEINDFPILVTVANSNNVVEQLEERGLIRNKDFITSRELQIYVLKKQGATDNEIKQAFTERQDL